MNHLSFKHRQSLLQTMIVMVGAILLNACSSGLLQDGSNAESTGSVVGLVSTPNIAVPNQKLPGQPGPIKFEVQVRRAGFDGQVQLDLQDLPKGASVNSITLEPNQDVASFVLPGLGKLNAKATVRLRFAGLELSRSVSLSAAKLVVDLPGGTYSQTLRNINANVDSSAFVTQQVYANFQGSTCQVMVRSLNAGMYVCFNDAIRVGQTYNLIVAREAIPGTASITYFQGPASKSNRQALWDSVSGSIKVLSISRSKIEFSINAANFAPAKGFGKNLATGEFMLESSVTVTDISNLP